MPIRKRFSIRPLVTTGLLLALSTLSACGGDDPTGLSDMSSTMSATVDGEQWTAVVVTASASGGLIAVGASNAAAEGIGFAFMDVGPGTYTMGSGAVTNANYSEGGNTWLAGSTNGSGSLVLTTVTATRIVGTFSFQAETFTGAVPATRSITNGVFDIEY